MGGRAFYVMNHEVKARYFSMVEFSPNTSPDLFPVVKAPGTFRVFCLGGSTTVGFPYGYVGAFSTGLRDRLRRLFPDRTIEVVNLGITATNSTTTLDIAADLLDVGPDLVIVYDGHNEFYGALGVASNETPTSSRWITHAYLRAVHLRSFQALRVLYNHVRSFASPARESAANGTLMERLARGRTIPLGSALYDNGLRTFEANLAELVTMLKRHGVPVIISTQASNLRDQPPFVSEAGPPPSPEMRTRFDLRYNAGLSSWMDGSIGDALAAFRLAAETDSSRADVHYQIGRCLDSLGREAEARLEFIRARDLDLLRFRTSSDFNDVIRRVATGPGVMLADIERVFEAASPDSLIGNSLILEHLHPTARGNFLVAAEYVRQMRRDGLLAPEKEWESRDTVSEEDLWASRPMTELDERIATRRIDALTSGWPFVPKDTPRPRTTTNDRLESIAERVARAELTWEQGHVAAARVYEQSVDLDRAAREYRAIINQVPYNVSPYLALGRLEAARGRWNAAREVLDASLLIERTFGALSLLGTVAINAGRPEEAVERLRAARSLAPSSGDDAETWYLLGLALVRAHRNAEALAEVEALLRRHPDHRQARDLLAFLEKRRSP